MRGNRTFSVPEPIVSDFTPINRAASPGGLSQQENEITTPASTLHETSFGKHSSKRSSIAPAPKRQKRQPTAPRKKDGKTVQAKKAEVGKNDRVSGCQDVAQSLRGNAVAAPNNNLLSVESKSTISASFLNASRDTGLLPNSLGQKSTSERTQLPETSRRQFGLAERYQAAYANDEHGAGAIMTVPSVQEAGDYEPPRRKNYLFERQSGQQERIGSIFQHDSVHSNGAKYEDFEIPPSGQLGSRKGDALTNQKEHPAECSDVTNLIPDEFFEGVDLDCLENDDEFPAKEESQRAIVESMASPALDTDYGSDWQPQDLSDNNSIDDDVGMGEKRRCSEDCSNEDQCTDNEATIRAIRNPSRMASSSRSPQILTRITGNAGKVKTCEVKATQDRDENCFNDDDLDQGIINLSTHAPERFGPNTPLTPTHRPSTPKLTLMPPNTYTPATSPQMLTSPINVPNVCFRISEALNAAAKASRSGIDAVIELYARVVLSERETSVSVKQFFQLGDLFTDKPVHLRATCIRNNDSKIFLGDGGKGKMARVMGRITRGEKGVWCEMVIMGIREVNWEDVEMAKRIHCWINCS